MLATLLLSVLCFICLNVVMSIMVAWWWHAKDGQGRVARLLRKFSPAKQANILPLIKPAPSWDRLLEEYEGNIGRVARRVFGTPTEVTLKTATGQLVGFHGWSMWASNINPQYGEVPECWQPSVTTTLLYLNTDGEYLVADAEWVQEGKTILVNSFSWHERAEDVVTALQEATYTRAGRRQWNRLCQKWPLFHSEELPQVRSF